MATDSWTDGTGTWQTNADWSLGHPPAAGDDAVVNLATANVSISNYQIAAINSLTVTNTSATVAISSPGTTESITGFVSLGSGGTLNLDSSNGTGGTTLSVGGTLTNTGGNLNIGNAGLSASSTLNVGAGGLVNTGGAINLTGANTMFASPLATLNVNAAAPATWSGALSLNFDSLVEFASGGITAIAASSTIHLNTSHSVIAIAGTTGSNSALTGLASNAGSLLLDDGSGLAAGASITTNAGVNFSNSGKISVQGGSFGSTLAIGGTLTNSNTVDVDTSGGTGGSTLAVAGALGNTGNIYIGNGAATASTTVTAAGLVNTGRIFLGSNGANQALLDITAAAPTAWTGLVQMTGNALLEFASGGIGTVASGGDIRLTGTAVHIAIAGTTGSNSALTGISEIAGALRLHSIGGLGLTGGLTVSNDLEVDDAGGDGGTSLTIAQTLTDSGNIYIGNGAATASTTVTAAGLVNTGRIFLGSNGANQALLDITAAAPTAWTGFVQMSGNALLEFASGGIGTVAGGGDIRLFGTAAHIAIAGTTGSNSALTGISEIAGALRLHSIGGLGLTGGLTVSNDLEVDDAGGDGGTSLTIAQTLTDSGNIYIGNGAATASTTVTAAGLVNTGRIFLGSNGANQALLDITAAAPTAWTGFVQMSGNALLEFASGGIGTVAGGGDIRLFGTAAHIAIAGTTGSNSALTGISDIAGALRLHSIGGLGLTGGLTVSNDLEVDDAGGDGGTSLTIAQTLTDSGNVYIGNNSATAATTVTAAGLVNTGRIFLAGSGANQGVLQLTGPATDSNVISIGAASALTIAAGSSLTQTGGVTTVVGTLAGAVDVTGGQLFFNGPLAANPGLSLSGTGLVEFGTTVGSAQAVTFGSGGTLQLDQPTSFGGAIKSFQPGDTIDLRGVGLETSASYSGGMLTLSGGSATVTLALTTPTPSPVFTLGTDGQAGTLAGTFVRLQSQSVLSGTYLNGIVLSNPTTQQPSTVTPTGYVTNQGTAHSGDAVYGTNAAAWNFTNYGKINAPAAGATGVYLAAGGTITNRVGTLPGGGPSPGLIAGAVYGVHIAGSPGTVHNLGTIAGTGTFADGVALFAGGSVTNGASGAATAVIAGSGRRGVFVYGGLGTVTNYATILGGGSYVGVYLKAGGLVTNRAGGLIQGSVGGVAIGHAAGTVANYGDIGGTAAAAGGVFLGAGGLVANFATLAGPASGVEVLGAAGTVLNHGSILATEISGFPAAIYFAAGGSVVNYGAVGAPGGTSGIAVNFAAGGAVTNAAGGTLSGSADAVVIAGSAGGSLANSGLVAGAIDGVVLKAAGAAASNAGTIVGSAAYGVYLYAGDSAVNQTGGLVTGRYEGVLATHAAGTVLNAGTIASTGPNGAGVAFQASAAGSTVKNAGTIAGSSGNAVLFGGGGNRLIVDPGAVFGGLVNGGTGNDTLELASAAGTGTLAGIGTSVVGFGALVFDAGAVWRVGGNAAGLEAEAITGFAPGDTIDLAGIVANGDAYAGGILTLTNNGAVVAQLTLSTTVANPAFPLAPDGSGGTLIGVTTAGAGTVFTGTYLNGIVLSNPATQQPSTLAPSGYVTNQGTAHSGDAVYGTNAAAWYFTNLGRIDATNTAGIGVRLVAGGTVRNSGPLSGGVNGVVIDAAPGTVVNGATIAATDTTTGAGIAFHAGGLVSNIPGAAITGFNNGVFITGSPGTAAGTLVNQGLVAGTGPNSSAVDLPAGGRVVNGPGAALITGGNNGILITGGPGIVANTGTVAAPGPIFAPATGSIVGGNAVQLNAGGVVTNGQSGAAAGLIVGYHVGVLASGTAAATVANFGTVASLQSAVISFFGVGVQLSGGGSLGNYGLITSPQRGVIIGNTAGGAGTVTNSGTIAVTDQYTVANGATLFPTAVLLDFGGIVVNRAGGLIASGRNAVEIANHPGTVLNAATIESSATNLTTVGSFHGTGILLSQGGLVVNGAGGATGALIQGYELAAYLGGSSGVPTAGAVGTVVNYGTIAVTGQGTVATSSVNLVSGGAIDNFGLITNAATIGNSSRAAARISGTPGTVANFGSILAAANHGINLANGGLAVNHGLVAATGSLSAVVSGNSAALGGGTVENFATIANTGNGLGVHLVTGGYVLDAAGGLIRGGSDGIYIGGDNGTLVAGATGMVVNLGTVAGVLGVDFGIGGSTLVNGGTVAGSGGTAVAFGGSGNRLVVDPGAVFTGLVNGGSGSTLELAPGGSGSITGIGTQFVGFGTVAVDAAAQWLFTGSNTVASLTNSGTVIDGGALAVGGGLTNGGLVDIGAGAALSLVGGGSGGSIAFTGAGGRLQIGTAGQPAPLSSAITGFAVGDTIDEAGVVANGDTYAGGVLTLTENGSAVAQLNLATGLANPSFRLASDGAGGTAITLAAHPANQFGGTYFSTIVLYQPSTQNPATLTATGLVEVTSEIGILGTAGFPWTLANYGSVTVAGSFGQGIELTAGGLVANHGLVSGFGAGIEIDAASGTLINAGVVLASGTPGIGVALNAGGTLVNTGTVMGRVGISVAGGQIVQSGTVIGSGGTAVALSGGALVLMPGAVIAGIAQGDQNTRLELGTGAAIGTLSGLGSNFTQFGTLAVDPGAVWQVSGQTATQPAVVNDGTLIVPGSNLGLGNLSADPGRQGLIVLGDGALAEFAGPVAAAETLAFADGSTARLDQAAGFAGAITGFNLGDAIDLAGAVVNAETYAGGVLTLTNSGALVAQLNLQTAVAGPVFALAPDGNGGTLLTLSAGVSGAVHWVGANGTLSGDFDAAANWNPAVVPAAANDAVLDAPGTTPYTVASAQNNTVQSIALLSNATLDITAGVFAAALGTGTGSNAGTIRVEAGATLASGASLVSSGTITGGGSIMAPIDNLGLIEAAGGTLVLGGAVGGPGAAVIDAGAGLELAGADTAAVTFAATGGLILDQPGQFAGAVAGFQAGDTLDLEGLVADSAQYAGGVLALYQGGNPVLQLSLTTPVANPGFALRPDGSGGSLVSLAAGGGTTIHWVGSTAGLSGSFDTALDWRPAVVPAAGNDAILDAPGTAPYTVTSTGDRTVNGVSLLRNATLAVAAGAFTTGYLTNAGTVTVAAGAALAVESSLANTGVLLAQGGGVQLAAGGYFANSGMLAAAAGGSLTIAGSLADTGTVAARGTGTVTIAAGGALAGYGTIRGPLDNEGLITAQGGTLTLTGNVAGAGSAVIAAGAALALGGADAQSIGFGGTAAQLLLSQPGLFAGAITGFRTGDAVDLAGLAADAASAAGGVVTLTSGGAVVAELVVATPLKNPQFLVSPDQNGGTFLGVAPGVAGTARWIGANGSISGDFDNAANWSPAVVPTAGYAAVLDAPGGLDYTVTSAADNTVKSLSLLSNATLDVTAGTFTENLGGANAGTILVEAGAGFAAAGSITGTGTVALAGGIASFGGAVAAAQTMLFSAADSTLTIDQPGGFAATIAGFQAGDAIDLAQLPATGLGFAGGVLTVTDGGATVAALSLAGSYTSADFALSGDGAGGSRITFATAAPPGTQLFDFVFVYADGAAYYTGTVADDGSLGYAQIAASANPTIGIAGGGTYTLTAAGSTDEPAGAVSVGQFFPATNSSAAFTPILTQQGRFDGSAGLGSESDTILVNASSFPFSDLIEPRPFG